MVYLTSKSPPVVQDDRREKTKLSAKLKVQRATIVATLVLATIGIWTLPSPARAEMRHYYQSGAWTNYAGTNEDNALTCGMMVNNQVSEIHIKYFAASNSVEIHLFKNTWRIPEGTKVQVEIGFDRNLWGSTDKAYGTSRKGDGMVAIKLAPEKQASFFQEVAHADKMWMRFPGGTEGLWEVNMTGSRKAPSRRSRSV